VVLIVLVGGIAIYSQTTLILEAANFGLREGRINGGIVASNDHAISTLVLGLIKGAIRGIDDVGPIHSVLRISGHSERCRDGSQRATAMHEVDLPVRLANQFGTLCAAGQRNAGQNRSKLLAT
jgi:hypothetical protein